MKAIITVGKVKETDKAILVNFWSSGNYKGFKNAEKYCTQVVWIPKSQIEILETINKVSFYNSYHQLKTNRGQIVDGKMKTTFVNDAIKIAIPEWLYKKSMVYGLDV